MNVFDYVFGYATNEGHVGIVRADSKQEAIERIEDCTGSNVVEIVCMNEFDNDYGVIVFNEGRIDDERS